MILLDIAPPVPRDHPRAHPRPLRNNKHGFLKTEQESIAFLALFRNVCRMMRISRIEDFALKDMSDPNQKRCCLFNTGFAFE